MGVRIAGVGHYAPAKVLTNDDLEKILDTSDEWITTRTGMKRRHIAAPDEATSDLALAAAKDALARASLKPKEIDCYVVATVTPDFAFPATGCIVASKLGVAGKPAFDIEIACSGFIYGLTVVSSLIRAGVYKRVMLIGAETLTKLVNYEDRSTAILFGDGAGAVILEESEIDSFLAADLGSDGTTPETLYLPAGGSRQPITPAALAAHDDKIHMAGREVFKYAVNRMVESSLKALQRANLSPSDVSFLIPHQANRRIIDAAAQRLAVPPERVIVNIQEYGNTSAASIPLALSEAESEKRFKRGDLIVFTGFGAGLSWGAVAWRWAA
ncbi:MAG: ketoacyl-ACP synthase III [Candidatus Eremiobacteraeota bacterium]|nr:ketoacyl-ACP synthase III [Candidatus Eremiobacteraeota bacterium]